MITSGVKSNKPRFKRRSISHALSFFIVIIVCVMGLLVTGLLFIRIGQAVHHSQQAHVHSQMYVLKEDVGDYLTNLEHILKDHTAFPVLVQGVMQPDNYRGSVQDFMESLTFLGQPYQEVLLDFQGHFIHASHQKILFDYQHQPWVIALLNGEQEQYRGVSQHRDGQYYWRLALPISYNRVPEGVLVVEVPLDSLGEKLSSKLAGALSLEVIWKGKVIQRIGTLFSGQMIELFESFSGTNLRFYIDNRVSDRVRNRLLIENLLLLLALGVIATLIAIYLGRRWFVEPIKKLRAFTHDFADNNQHRLSINDQDVKELKDLADDFNLMADRVRSREDAMRNSHQELTEVYEQLKGSQAQLVQAEKKSSLGTLAAGIAHEINNPVSFINSNVGTLQNYVNVIVPLLRDCYDHGKQEQKDQQVRFDDIQQRWQEDDIDFLLEDIAPILEDTIAGTDRVKEIVAGLKTFVHTDDAGEELFNLNDCVENTLKMVWNELKYKCEVHKHLADIPWIYGNPGQINQVLTNLLVNAAQAIPERGEITIQTTLDNNNAVLRVSDTGTGISPENMEKLFTPFFTTKEVGQGTGLGLSISYGIIDQHGGRLQADSEVGKGTTFTIFLPLPLSE